MTGKRYVVALLASFAANNVLASEQTFSSGAYNFSSLTDTELTITTRPGWLEQGQNQSNDSNQIEVADPPLLYNTHTPGSRITFHHAFDYAGRLPRQGPLALGIITAYNSEVSQENEAIYGALGYSSAGSNAFILDYQLTDQTRIALIRTSYFFTRSGQDRESKFQTGIYIGTSF